MLDLYWITITDNQHTCSVCFSTPAQKIHTSSETYLALMKDNFYEMQLRGEIEVKVKDPSCAVNFIKCSLVRSKKKKKKTQIFM